MKNVFKNLILVVLFVMVSVLGTTRVNAESKYIEAIDIKIKDKSGTIIVEEPTITDGQISSGIRFNEVGDFVNYELTLKNNESEKYKIRSITDNNDNESLGIEYTYGEDFIAEGETTKITIKLIYKSKLINKNLSLNDLEIKLNFENETGTNSQITINPKTNDSILEYFLLVIVSGLGLFFVINKKRINKFKTGILLLIIAILIIPFAVFANEKFELSLKFTDVELKGEFEVYQITINPNNDTSIIIKNITYGEPIGELPEVEKEGYAFDKWEDEDGNEITEDTIITKQIVINAKYNLAKYTVIFDSNGGSGSMTNQEIYSGILTNLSLNTFTAPENMIFDSWNTEANGGGTSYTDGGKINLVKSDGETITLYAQWKPTTQTWSMTSDNVHVTDGYITLEVGDQITGYSVNVDNTTYGDGNWFVLGAQDGKLLITLKSGVGQRAVQGNALNWPSFVANLDSIASHYKNPTYTDNSRSINLSDINRVTGFTPYEMESITFTNDNGVIRTKYIPDNVNDYAHTLYYYDFESSSWKKLSNGSSISFASNGYQYGPGPGQNNVNGSEKAYDLIFKDTHDKNWMIDGHVVTYRGNQYWLADAVIVTSAGQGLIYYCFQYIDYEKVDWVIAGKSEDNPADSSYSEFDNFVRPVVTLKSEVRINASGTIIN